MRSNETHIEKQAALRENLQSLEGKLLAEMRKNVLGEEAQMTFTQMLEMVNANTEANIMLMKIAGLRTLQKNNLPFQKALNKYEAFLDMKRKILSTLPDQKKVEVAAAERRGKQNGINSVLAEIDQAAKKIKTVEKNVGEQISALGPFLGIRVTGFTTFYDRKKAVDELNRKIATHNNDETVTALSKSFDVDQVEPLDLVVEENKAAWQEQVGKIESALSKIDEQLADLTNLKEKSKEIEKAETSLAKEKETVEAGNQAWAEKNNQSMDEQIDEKLTEKVDSLARKLYEARSEHGQLTSEVFTLPEVDITRFPEIQPQLTEFLASAAEFVRAANTSLPPINQHSFERYEGAVRNYREDVARLVYDDSKGASNATRFRDNYFTEKKDSFYNPARIPEVTPIVKIVAVDEIEKKIANLTEQRARMEGKLKEYQRKIAIVDAEEKVGDKFNQLEARKNELVKGVIDQSFARNFGNEVKKQLVEAGGEVDNKAEEIYQKTFERYERLTTVLHECNEYDGHLKEQEDSLSEFSAIDFTKLTEVPKEITLGHKFAVNNHMKSILNGDDSEKMIAGVQGMVNNEIASAIYKANRDHLGKRILKTIAHALTGGKAFRDTFWKSHGEVAREKIKFVVEDKTTPKPR